MHLTQKQEPIAVNPTSGPLDRAQFEAIREFDTCAIANAIERFHVRLRNEGFTSPGLRCVTGGSPRVLGYAATFRVRSADPPMTGRSYLERTDWWSDIKKLPMPRIAVIEDMDEQPGAGSSVGEVHAAILKAFGCNAVITNGAVRDLGAVSAMHLPMFAQSITVSHSYYHMIDFGQSVNIFGLEVQPGDLLYSDCHGVVSIPASVAASVAEVAAQNRMRELRVLQACQSPDFTEENLLQAIQSNL
jgi:4-hydroxy-4-methyl-2-oxoglutarate aldolase